MRKKIEIIAMAFAAFIGTAQADESHELRLTSPGGQHEVRFYPYLSETGAHQVNYEIRYQGKEVVSASRAGLQMDNRTWEMALGQRDLTQPDCWMDALEVDSVSYQPTVDNTWQPLYGERSTVRDRYTAATLYLSRHDKSAYRLNIEVRAYDEGIAFRYFLPEHPQAIFHKVTGDLTEYSFAEHTMAFAEEWAQDRFHHVSVDEMPRPVERALTLQLPNGLWTALTDADVDDWCLTKFRTSSRKPHTLESVMYSPVDIVTYYATPWKVVMTAPTPGELLEHNDIILNLNPPCQIADTNWICPGKIMREVTISTEGALATIDFCAAHHIQYMLFDWQWYMPCTSHDGDATKVVAKLDMPRVIAYGREKGVGVWVYVNQHALMKQARELFLLLHEWGVVGVKSGFVQYASHRWSTWLHDLVRLAAENHLMMNIHDEFRPSGFSRTYPNLLTQEGICGNEEFPDATHNVTLPFTRMINGAADYTICYYDRRLKTTHAHQLAASLVFYSPLQTLFWYDRPSAYQGEPEVEWFEQLQTTFDESKVLAGQPGEQIVMARRKGDTWFVGAMTNNDARRTEINLDFLDKDQWYVAHCYTDGGEEIATRTHVKCSQYLVRGGRQLRLNLQASGGAAIRLTPATKEEQKELKKYNSQWI
jgi:alpha-glucosidase